jgi:hypothetical protein
MKKIRFPIQSPSRYFPDDAMKPKILILLLLASTVFFQIKGIFSSTAGFDFYNPWAVCNAQKWSIAPLGNPYIDAARYAEVLNAHANHSQDPRFKAANEARRVLVQLTGTPLFYAAFGYLPADYSHAYVIFQKIQIVLFILSVLILGRLYRGDLFCVSLFVLLLSILYQPIVSDFLVGNVNAIQLFMLALLMVIVEWESAANTPGRQLRRGVVLLFAMAALSLFKPNLAMVAVFLAANLWIRRGTRLFAIAAAGAVALSLALAVLPCLSFHSWTIWQDWFRTVFCGDHNKIVVLVADGNYATVPIISEAIGIPNIAGTLGLAAALVLSLVGALWIFNPGARWSLTSIREVAVRSIQDPHLAAAAAVVVTLALAPLVWVHYYTFLLLPAFWLIWTKHRWSQSDTMGMLSILLCSVPSLLNNIGLGRVAIYCYSISLIPLWIGIVTEMALRQTKKPVSP